MSLFETLKSVDCIFGQKRDGFKQRFSSSWAALSAKFMDLPLYVTIMLQSRIQRCR